MQANFSRRDQSSWIASPEDVPDYSEELANIRGKGLNLIQENENVPSIVEQLPAEDYSQKQYSSHVRYLLSRSRLGFGQHDHDAWFKIIEEIYKHLDNIPIISSILKVLEYAETLEIIFDFAANSIVDLDPTQNSSTSGACDYKTRRLYIGAKSTDIVLGTLAHELCHLAMQIIYNNDCNPYNASDISTKANFDKIVENYSRKIGLNPIISRIFTTYKNRDEWPSEMIVRVPHLLAHYHDNPVMLKKLKEEAVELFDFYERYTRKDVLKFIEIPNRIRNQHRIQRLNNFLGDLDSLQKSEIRLVDDKFKVEGTECVLLIESALPQLAKLNVFGTLSNKKDRDVRNCCIFAKASHFTNDNTVREINEANQFIPQPILIVDCACDYNAYQDDLWKAIDSFQKKQSIILIGESRLADSAVSRCNQYETRRINICYTWKDLTRYSQNILLDKNVDFQGYIVTFKDIISSNSLLCDVLLDDMLKDEVISLGKPILNTNQLDAYYIERTFLQNPCSYDEANLQSLLTSDDLVLSPQRKVVILSDDVGMGKTSVLINLSKQIKRRYPSYWVSKLNLIDFIGIFEDCIKNATEIDQLLFKMLDFTSQKEQGIFKDVFQRNEVIIMLDNLDELESSHKKIVTDLLQHLQLIRIRQLWVTTRPGVGNNLEKLLEVDSLRLQPFSEEDQIKCLINLWKSLLQSSDDQNISQLDFFARRLLKTVSESINDKDLRFASNPLHVRMLAESFQGELLEFLNPETCSPVELIAFDLFYLYDKFVDQKYIAYVTSDSRDVAEILSNGISVRKVHQLLALEVLFPKQFELFSKPKRIHTLEHDKMNRIGIAQYVGNRAYFTHRTFGEYFVADLIANRFSKTEEAFEKFFLNRILIDDDWRVVRGFLNGLFGNIVNNKNRLERYGHHIKELWRETRMNSLIRNLLQPQQREGQDFRDEFTNKSVTKLQEFDRLTYRSWHNNSWTGYNLGGTILHQAIQEGNDNIAHFLLNTIEQDLKSLFLYDNRIGQNIWHGASISGNLQVLNKLLELVTSKVIEFTPEDLKGFFSSNDQNKHCPWHWIPYHNNPELLQITRTLIESNYLDDKVIFHTKDIFGRTLAHWTALYGTVDTLNGLWKLGVDLQLDLRNSLTDKDQFGRSIWHFAIYNKNVDIFAKLWSLAVEIGLNLKEDVLLNMDKNKKTIWQQSAIAMESPELFKRICLLIKETPTIIKELLLFKDDRNQNILHWIVQNKQMETLTTLVDFMRPLDFDQYFLDEFCFCEDNEKHTIWYLVVENNDFQTLEKLWSWLKSTGLSVERLKKVLFDQEDGIVANTEWVPSSEYNEIVGVLRSIAKEIGVDIENELFFFECSHLDSII
ncbi:AAA protein [Oryctes borbonicus]|uniref:AAA protein n=1 Tax=Oryctes borbonicus TaxID=1629725 RepID=A0A0T6BBC1_9SCAR|nr:AAA protein [Oryctes borbonicus]